MQSKRELHGANCEARKRMWKSQYEILAHEWSRNIWCGAGYVHFGTAAYPGGILASGPDGPEPCRDSEPLDNHVLAGVLGDRPKPKTPFQVSLGYLIYGNALPRPAHITLSTALRSRFARVVKYAWFAAASLTWLFCPPPGPSLPGNTSTAHFASAAGYFIECVTLWPLIAYSTLQGPQQQRLKHWSWLASNIVENTSTGTQ